MPRRPSDSEIIRSQIEAAAAKIYSTEQIEERIADALLEYGQFEDHLKADELEVILRNVVYSLFAQQTVAGLEVGIIHDVVSMDVEIEDGEAQVAFIVHIHKPIIVFFEMQYTLENDPDSAQTRLQVQEGTFKIKERTRRFDLKAKAALAAMNVPRIARQELVHLATVIKKTLPDQLQKQGVKGELSKINLALNEDGLNVFLQGDFFTVQGN